MLIDSYIGYGGRYGLRDAGASVEAPREPPTPAGPPAWQRALHSVARLAQPEDSRGEHVALSSWDHAPTHVLDDDADPFDDDSA